MTVMQWQALVPLLVLAAGGTLVLLMAAFVRQHALVALTAGFALVVALMTLPWGGQALPVTVGELLVIDRLTLYFWCLILLATLATVALCFVHFRDSDERPEEVYGLLVLAASGACVMAGSQHFISLFLGLELLSVPLIILVGYTHGVVRSVEAALKYLVLAGFATSLLLFGMAMVYGALGSMAFADLAVPTSPGSQLYWLAGLALVSVGLAFKLSLVPLHFWTPDVYQGAPTPVTAFLATVSKGAALMLVLRLLQAMDVPLGSALWSALVGITAASILVGNWLALRQDNLKRLLAYSSIAHAGYVMAGLLAGGALAVEVTGFYLAFYFATTLGAFGVLILLRHNQGEVEDLAEVRGLFWHRPWLAGVMTVMLLSLAGVPLTGGFVAKFYVLAAGAHERLWGLMLIVIAGSAVGLYYYLRVIVTMLGRKQAEVARPVPAMAGRLAILLISLLTLWLGIFPAPVMDLLTAGAPQ